MQPAPDPPAKPQCALRCQGGVGESKPSPFGDHGFGASSLCQKPDKNTTKAQPPETGWVPRSQAEEPPPSPKTGQQQAEDKARAAGGRLEGSHGATTEQLAPVGLTEAISNPSKQSPGSCPSHLPGPHTNTWKTALDGAGRGESRAKGIKAPARHRRGVGGSTPAAGAGRRGPFPSARTQPTCHGCSAVHRRLTST